MAKQITVTMNARITLIETGTEEQYQNLMERMRLFGGEAEFKEFIAKDVAETLRDGDLMAADAVVSDIEFSFQDIETEVVG